MPLYLCGNCNLFGTFGPSKQNIVPHFTVRRSKSRRPNKEGPVLGDWKKLTNENNEGLSVRLVHPPGEVKFANRSSQHLRLRQIERQIRLDWRRKLAHFSRKLSGSVTTFPETNGVLLSRCGVLYHWLEQWADLLWILSVRVGNLLGWALHRPQNWRQLFFARRLRCRSFLRKKTSLALDLRLLQTQNFIRVMRAGWAMLVWHLLLVRFEGGCLARSQTVHSSLLPRLWHFHWLEEQWLEEPDERRLRNQWALLFVWAGLPKIQIWRSLHRSWQSLF